ncbi:MAG: DUF2244 domain-containing protein [Thiobacillus sp.]|nr:DUF2244 domain-containing protein [Thiobacillus sp.]
MDEPVRETAGAYVFHSRPRCALSQGQERRVFWTLAAGAFGIALGFSALGYWLVLPFAGLEVGLLAWAFDALRAREGNYETLTIEGDAVVLEWRKEDGCGRRELNRRWVRIESDCSAPGRHCRISVCSHGCGTEVGQYLNDEARLQLAATLRSRLQV